MALFKIGMHIERIVEAENYEQALSQLFTPETKGFINIDMVEEIKQ
jgi:hypothetical protein